MQRITIEVPPLAPTETKNLANVINQLGPNPTLNEKDIVKALNGVADGCDALGRTPLMCAIIHANLPAIQWLLQINYLGYNKREVHWETYVDGMNALMHAVNYDSQSETKEEKIPTDRRRAVLDFILSKSPAWTKFIGFFPNGVQDQIKEVAEQAGKAGNHHFAQIIYSESERVEHNNDFFHRAYIDMFAQAIANNRIKLVSSMTWGHGTFQSRGHVEELAVQCGNSLEMTKVLIRHGYKFSLGGILKIHQKNEDKDSKDFDDLYNNMISESICTEEMNSIFKLKVNCLYVLNKLTDKFSIHKTHPDVFLKNLLIMQSEQADGNYSKQELEYYSKVYPYIFFTHANHHHLQLAMKLPNGNLKNETCERIIPCILIEMAYNEHYHPSCIECTFKDTLKLFDVNDPSYVSYMKMVIQSIKNLKHNSSEKIEAKFKKEALDHLINCYSTTKNPEGVKSCIKDLLQQGANLTLGALRVAINYHDISLLKLLITECREHTDWASDFLPSDIAFEFWKDPMAALRFFSKKDLKTEDHWRPYNARENHTDAEEIKVTDSKSDNVKALSALLHNVFTAKTDKSINIEYKDVFTAIDHMVEINKDWRITQNDWEVAVKIDYPPLLDKLLDTNRGDVFELFAEAIKNKKNDTIIYLIGRCFKDNKIPAKAIMIANDFEDYQTLKLLLSYPHADDFKGFDVSWFLSRYHKAAQCNNQLTNELLHEIMNLLAGKNIPFSAEAFDMAIGLQLDTIADLLIDNIQKQNRILLDKLLEHAASHSNEKYITKLIERGANVCSYHCWPAHENVLYLLVNHLTKQKGEISFDLLKIAIQHQTIRQTVIDAWLKQRSTIQKHHWEFAATQTDTTLFDLLVSLKKDYPIALCKAAGKGRLDLVKKVFIESDCCQWSEAQITEARKCYMYFSEYKTNSHLDNILFLAIMPTVDMLEKHERYLQLDQDEKDLLSKLIMERTKSRSAPMPENKVTPVKDDSSKTTLQEKKDSLPTGLAQHNLFYTQKRSVSSTNSIEFTQVLQRQVLLDLGKDLMAAMRLFPDDPSYLTWYQEIQRKFEATNKTENYSLTRL